MACSLPYTDSEVEALVQRLIHEDKGRQDALLELAFRFEDSCALRDDLRKVYEKCNDISQESRDLICTLLKERSEKDRKLYLSMAKIVEYGQDSPRVCPRHQLPLSAITRSHSLQLRENPIIRILEALMPSMSDM
ncbi:hypothetical protein Tco_0900452 [Tanacetum coccineum]